MQDNMVAGGTAGLVGSIAQESYALVLKGLGVVDRSYADFSFCLLTAVRGKEGLDVIVGVLSNMAIGILFGVVFAYVVSATSMKYLLLKGFWYGWVLWMLLSSFGAIYNLPVFRGIPAYIALITLSGSILWGVTTALSLQYISKKNML